MGANALPITDWPWTERSAHRWVGNTCWGDAKNQGRQQIRLFAEITVRRKGRRCYGEWYRREAKLNQLGIQRVTCGLPITEFAHKARIVGDAQVGALLAALDMTAQRRRSAALDRRHDLELAEAHMAGMGGTPS